MTKMHFQAFAKEINQPAVWTLDQRRAMYALIIRTVGQFNARFDQARFRTACGLDGEV
jgi:hypothetical protein